MMKWISCDSLNIQDSTMTQLPDVSLNGCILMNANNSTPTSLVDPFTTKCPTHMIVHRTHTS